MAWFLIQLALGTLSCYLHVVEGQTNLKLKGDFTDLDFPQAAVDYANQGKVIIEKKRVNIDGTNIFYREAAPGDAVKPQGKTLFLLHGAAFTSLTWTTLNPSRRQVDTIPKLAAAGFNVIAVDLPGFGNSERGIRGDRGEFLAKLVATISPTRPVIVSPSYSGSYAMPMLVQQPNVFCGFVPVAPGSASTYSGQLSDIKVPTLIVVGENDGKGSSRVLSQIPTSSEIIIIPRADHPAYLDNSKLWHQLLYNFLLSVDCDQQN